MKIITDDELNSVIRLLEEIIEDNSGQWNTDVDEEEEILSMLIAIRDKDYNITEHGGLPGVWLHRAKTGDPVPLWDLEDFENIL